MREADVWTTLKPFHPSRISLSGPASASAPPSPPAANAPGPTITAGRSAPANASVTAPGRPPSSFRSLPSHPTFIPRSTSGPSANTLPPLRAALRTRVAISGASQRMLEPTSSTTSAFSMPAMVEPVADQRIDMVPRLVADPLLVDVLIFARKDAHHLPLADVEADVRADRVHHVDRRHAAKLPRALLEQLRLLQQGSDRAHVGEIARQLARHRLLEVRGDLAVLAAIQHADLVDPGDLGREADAARALDAPVHRRLDDRAHIFVVERALVLLVAREAAAVGHRLVLKVAFAALVADRAIERVVDEQELHHPFARLLDHRRVGADHLAVGGRQSAARLWLGRSGS